MSGLSYLHRHFSGGRIADVEVDLCTKGGVEGVLDDWCLCLLSTTLYNTVWVGPWAARWKHNSDWSLKCSRPLSIRATPCNKLTCIMCDSSARLCMVLLHTHVLIK